jgi:hypothetical protein
MKKGTRILFKAGRGGTDKRDNPEYMKTWAATAIVMEQQGRHHILKGFWPQLDSAAVIERSSPDKKNPKIAPNAWEKEVDVEEEETWRAKTPPKKENEQEKRLAAIEKKQETQTALVSSLSTALSKQKFQCNQVIVKAGIALDPSNKAMQALAQHIEEIGKFEKIMSTSIPTHAKTSKHKSRKSRNTSRLSPTYPKLKCQI